MTKRSSAGSDNVDESDADGAKTDGDVDVSGARAAGGSAGSGDGGGGVVCGATCDNVDDGDPDIADDTVLFPQRFDPWPTEIEGVPVTLGSFERAGSQSVCFSRLSSKHHHKCFVTSRTITECFGTLLGTSCSPTVRQFCMCLIV